MYSVSVIIPAYNCERYIEEAVQSVLAQTYRDYELIIIDDGSTDRTRERVRPFSAMKNVRILAQKNSGPSRARNRGIQASGGKYCAFLDSDDVMMPERLQMQVAAMEKRKDVGMIYSDLMTFNETGIVHRTKKAFTRPYAGEVLDKLVLGNFITTSTVMARRECLEKVGLFDERMNHSEDYKMWLQMARAYAIEYLDVPLTKYRYQPAGLSSNRITMSTSSYEVVKEFWEDNKEYRRKHSVLCRKSLANQLVNIGHAYWCCGRNGESARILARSVLTYPLIKETYKVMAKMMLGVLRRRSSREKLIKQVSGEKDGLNI